MPERTAVFTVRFAPSLIAGLRERADSRGLTLSATVAEAVRGISGVLASGAVAGRVEIESCLIGSPARGWRRRRGLGARAAPSDWQRTERR